MISSLDNSTSPLIGIALHFFAFLLGSIPVGHIIARMHGVDIRKQGSGNTGATNVARTIGKKAGIITLLLDTLKGFLGVQLAWLILPNNVFGPPFQPNDLFSTLGVCAVFGHCYSPFLKGKGGKGVATGLGVFLALSPLVTLGSILVFAIAFASTKYVSLGSILGAAAMPVIIFLAQGMEQPLLLLSVTLTSILVISRHRANISRLISGNESKFSTKAKD